MADLLSGVVRRHSVEDLRGEWLARRDRADLSQVGNMAPMANEIQYFSGVGPASVSATLRGMQSRGVWFASDQLITR
jgi:hypothetical protein